MKKIHMIEILLLLILFGWTAFSNEQKYTVKSSEERIVALVSLIEKNLEGTSVLTSFNEEQRLWEVYKKVHLETLFPDVIDTVEMLWGSGIAFEMGEEILVLNTERIKILESYMTRECGTDGRGEFKEYVEELRSVRKKSFGNGTFCEAKDSSQEDAEGQEEERNPLITNPQWKNADGEPIMKALVGDEVLLCANVQDIPDGASAKIKVVEKDADGNDDDVATLTVTVSGGRIECKWKVIYTEDDDDADSEQEKAEKGYTLPEYAFTVECGSATSEESGQFDVYADFIARMSFEGKTLKNYPYILKLADGTYKTGETNDDGYIIENELPIGKIQIM